MHAARRSARGRLRLIESPVLSSFNDFGLAEPIIRALADENYVTPTPIQAQTVPLALSGRDVVGIAQTGTGKTAAFALPILQRLFTNRRRPAQRACRVLVLSPTRELSGQISDSFRGYARHIRPFAVELAIGGVPINRQIRALARGVEVLVATPGRLLDLVRERALSLDAIEVLVLDEADRMLDMGFIHDIRKIVSMVPKDRQTLFFSATMPQQIADLAKHMLRDPAKVAVTPQASTAERVDQRIIHTDKMAKPALLAEVIASEPIDRVIVFTRTKHGADKVVRSLAKAGVAAQAIHGNKSQNNRERALAAFRDGSVRTLVATDIAARGIDVSGVSHVINYDLPNVPESYVHRIGRTARAGADGIAISFCDHEERAYLRDIERLIRMTIPSTDRRGERIAPHRHASESTSSEKPHQGRDRDGRSRAARSRNGDMDGARAQEHRREGAREDGRRAHNPGGEGARQARPPRRRRSNGNQGRPHHAGAQVEGRRGLEANRQPGRRSRGADGTLGSMTFMQPVPSRDNGRVTD
ncbi:MAG TPA: DEAD/DEAH box helicase [Xanthobacteraceae bacterium]|nr:DEAD/DEAH box helicase [Xanthobacteraceae bacterium]